MFQFSNFEEKDKMLLYITFIGRQNKTEQTNKQTKPHHDSAIRDQDIYSLPILPSKKHSRYLNLDKL